jgi:hypothetical protein
MPEEQFMADAQVMNVTVSCDLFYFKEPTELLE